MWLFTQKAVCVVHFHYVFFCFCVHTTLECEYTATAYKINAKNRPQKNWWQKINSDTVYHMPWSVFYVWHAFNVYNRIYHINVHLHTFRSGNQSQRGRKYRLFNAKQWAQIITGKTFRKCYTIFFYSPIWIIIFTCPKTTWKC